MIELIRTDSSHPDFIVLVNALDKYLAKIDGEEHEFYHQFNTVAQLNHMVIAYLKQEAIACGAIKALDHERMEVKRMFTSPNVRSLGVASAVLSALEKWAKELNYKSCVLETGKRMPDAIGLYLKAGYQPMANYGQYIGVENSSCFEKKLINSQTDQLYS